MSFSLGTRPVWRDNFPMPKNSRYFLRTLRLCLALLASAFTSSAFADTLYFQLKLNHSIVPLPYSQSFNTISWAMDQNPTPSSPYTPGDFYVIYWMANTGMVGVNGGGFYQDSCGSISLSMPGQTSISVGRWLAIMQTSP